MPGLTTKGKNDALDAVLTGTKYVGLLTDARATADPTTEANGTNCPGYARKSVTHAAAAAGSKATSAAVTWTATGAWATVRHLGVWDALTGGNLLYTAPIGSSAADDKTLANTDTLTVASGQLSTSITAAT